MSPVLDEEHEYSQTPLNGKYFWACHPCGNSSKNGFDSPELCLSDFNQHVENSRTAWNREQAHASIKFDPSHPAHQVLQIVCRHYKYEPLEVLKSLGGAKLQVSRIAVYLVLTRLRLNHEEIGRLFYRRPSTMEVVERRIRARLKHDPELAEVVNTLASEVEETLVPYLRQEA